jgi:hypothetical protein
MRRRIQFLSAKLYFQLKVSRRVLVASKIESGIADRFSYKVDESNTPMKIKRWSGEIKPKNANDRRKYEHNLAHVRSKSKPWAALS